MSRIIETQRAINEQDCRWANDLEVEFVERTREIWRPLLQNRVLPNLAVCVVSCGINAVLHYGLVVQAQMGIR